MHDTLYVQTHLSTGTGSYYTPWRYGTVLYYESLKMKTRIPDLGRKTDPGDVIFKKPGTEFNQCIRVCKKLLYKSDTHMPVHFFNASSG
jgi:hypothetical protein